MKLFQKKAQGISVNVIIIAAIALIVLVVLIAVFTGSMGDWIAKLTGETSGDCAESFDGECRVSCWDTEVRAFGAKNCNAGEVCCVPKG